MSKVLELSVKYRTILNRANINTPLRLSHFFAQISHESNLKPINENLNYSASGLIKVFPKYFPTTELVNRYARKPEMIANRVYANRMGNGNENSGDGWKYRGRGFIQITGKNNYRALSNHFKVDYLNNPDLLLQEANAMLSAIWYWNTNNLNKFADKDNIDAVSDIINIGRLTSRFGDAKGFQDRKSKLIKYKLLFK